MSLFLLNNKLLSDWVFFIPFLVLFVIFLVIFIFSLVYIALNVYLNILKPLLYISIYFLLFIILSFYILYIINIDVYFYKNLLYFNINFIFILIVIILLLIIILFFSYFYFLFDKILIIEYSLMLLLALFGIFLVLISNDLFLLYLGIELQSYCFYVLVALKRYSNLSIEASLKYFILGSFASGIYLFGVSIIYGMLGSTNFSQIYIAINLFYHLHFLSLATFFGIIFIFVGILFKLALVPFHFWLPDVYEGAPTIIVAFLAIISKISFFFAFMNLYYFVFKNWTFYFLTDILLFIGFFSILVGGLLGLYETKIKRLLAYSGISHTGFMILALSLGSFSGIEAFFVYFFTYLLTLVNIFYILIFFRLSSFYFKLVYITDFIVLAKSNTFVTLNLFFLFLSLAGVPPFPGFFGKALVLKSLIESGYFYISAFIIFFSVINIVYYLRLCVFYFLFLLILILFLLNIL